MKRILPVFIALCLIVGSFVFLPKSSDKMTTLTRLDDLNGLDVGVQSGVNYEVFLEERCPDANPILFSDFTTMDQSLSQGKISAMLTESVSFAVDKIEHPSFEALEEPLESIGNYVIVKKSNKGQALLNELNDYITSYIADGTYDEIYSKWFTDYDRGNTFVDKSGITGINGEVVFTSEAGYEPVCFAGEAGDLQGFDVDFIYHFCRAYGYEPKIVPLEYEVMSAAIVSEKCAAATGIVKDEEREDEVAFSEPYFFYDIIAVYNSGISEEKGLIENIKSGFLKTFIRESRWKMFLNGIETTLLISVMAILLGTILGLLLYLWCMHGKKAERKFTDILCWLIGSTPTVVLLMVLYYIVFSNYAISNLFVAVIGFALQFGCNFYERIVSGIKAVGIGQEEAALAQGFNKNQTIFRILFPQAAEHFMPAYHGDVITLILETSVVGYITVMDLTKMSDLIRARTFAPFFPLIATSCIYYLLIWLITLVLNRLSISFNHSKRKKEKILKGIKTD